MGALQAHEQPQGHMQQHQPLKRHYAQHAQKEAQKQPSVSIKELVKKQERKKVAAYLALLKQTPCRSQPADDLAQPPVPAAPVGRQSSKHTLISPPISRSSAAHPTHTPAALPPHAAQPRTTSKPVSVAPQVSSPAQPSTSSPPWHLGAWYRTQELMDNLMFKSKQVDASLAPGTCFCSNMLRYLLFRHNPPSTFPHYACRCSCRPWWHARLGRARRCTSISYGIWASSYILWCAWGTHGRHDVCREVQVLHQPSKLVGIHKRNVGNPTKTGFVREIRRHFGQNPSNFPV